MPHTVGSTEVGIRVKKLSILSSKGVVDRAFGPGTYFFLPIINDWYILDTKIQNLQMTLDRSTGDMRTRDDLIFKTTDGNDISLDLTIAYHIDPTKAPMIIQYVGVNNTIIQRNIVRTIARSKPRDIFGELTSEVFMIAWRAPTG